MRGYNSLSYVVTALRSLETVHTAEETVQCSRCGFVSSQPTRFCPSCGLQLGLTTPVPNVPQYQPAVAGVPIEHHDSRARGFGQFFGIHPTIAFVALLVDLMLFGGDVMTMGALLPVSIGAGFVLGIITYLAQRRWYGDDRESASIKALILGLLTAIPTPLPAALYIPSGIVGLIHKIRGK
jgi:hypothetical protein